MELTEDQLKVAEIELQRYLPQSLKIYGFLVLRNRVKSDPYIVLVDRWPKFSVIICKPQYEQKTDLFKDTMVFANDEAILMETIRKASVIDWSRSGICLNSLDESHLDLVNQTWTFGKNQGAAGMIRNMVLNFPSCCVLDADGRPVSWILTYVSCALGMLYTLPEHRGKGYAKVLISSMAKRLSGQGYPVFCFIEEENIASYQLFKSMGFSEDPSYREAWYGFNDF
ncbi:glycine N-acyltransferase isoform X2 [Girardinichthys multiradiatus]|uniref:glycine N-acyltransferase isoform X2 n=1 Tax=Girardinichthys multiradiatus TaxID=208333 RepID=UPI001FABAEFE|nr:glycine N-acyltransferase isoform X2 [Girardinichthys multiradiatus]